MLNSPWVALIPESPATTRSDLSRARRICRSRAPIVRASPTSTENPLLTGPHTDTPNSYPGA